MGGIVEPYVFDQGTVYCGDALKVLEGLPDGSVQCIITSPPYYNQRQYTTDGVGEIGLEATFQAFISNLCDIFDEAKRVLKDNGTCWVVLGDSYTGADVAGACDKSLMQIPARFSIEMTNRKWILRNSIIWHKPSCMPSSVKDRFTVDYETVHFFSKNPKYKFNQQLEPYTKPLNRWGGTVHKADGVSNWDKGTGQKTYRRRNARPNPVGRNKRCVWAVNAKPSKIKHFAQFPSALIEPCIMAGTDKGDIILDPFGGSGTTALTAIKHDRKFIAIDLNHGYCEIMAKRVKAATAQLKLF